MKKTLMSTLLLAGIVGGMATTAHAADTATADTTMTASIESGGVTIETRTGSLDNTLIDFGTIAIGGSSEVKYQLVDVYNLTGSPVNTTIKLDEELNDGVTLAGVKDGGLSPNIGTSPIDISLVYSPEKTAESPDPSYHHHYLIDWKLSASNSAKPDPDLSRVMTFTASPDI